MRRSPLMPYMICRFSGRPASAHSTQSRQARASSIRPARVSAAIVYAESRTQA